MGLHWSAEINCTTAWLPLYWSSLSPSSAPSHSLSVTPKSKHSHTHIDTPSPTSPCSASASLGWCNLGQTAMKLVMENKSGYIRPFCALHIQYPHRQPWDVSWPIENQLYLLNKGAVAMKRMEGKLVNEIGSWLFDCKGHAAIYFSMKWNCCCLSYNHTDIR